MPEPVPAAPPYRGRRYRRHELALADGERLVLRKDGVIEHRGAAGATTKSWTPDDPEWPIQAIRFGIRPETPTVKPQSHTGRGPNPPAFWACAPTMDTDALQRRAFRFHQSLYVRTDGRVGHRLIGVPSLLLTTIGRRSGAQRTSTLVYGQHGDAFVVVGSNGGQDAEPAWLLNVRADPHVWVQVGRRKAPATARVVDGDDPDHARLWALMNRVNHDRYDGYQKRTSRKIALVTLTPRS